jgi:DUF4097 and DUF4098 domain-containing protein YvlB
MHKARVSYGLALLLAGCGVLNQQKATDERTQTVRHVAGAGLDVHVPNGSVEVTADPSLKEVEVIAKVTAYAETEGEAKARLPRVKVTVERRDDKTLHVAAEFPEGERNFQANCSFVIRLPDAAGCKVHTGNGSVTLRKLGGDADVETGNGWATVEGHTGPAKVKTGNGSVTLTAAGAGPFNLRTGNGSVTATLPASAGGTVRVHTGNGSVTVHGEGKAKSVSGDRRNKTVVLGEGGTDSEIHTGNGSVTLTVE